MIEGYKSLGIWKQFMRTQGKRIVTCFGWPCAKDVGVKVTTSHGGDHYPWSLLERDTGMCSMSSTCTRGGERMQAPCNVAGVGWQTKAAQRSSFPSVIHAIIFKTTLTECFLFQKTMVQAPVGCSMGSTGTLKRFPPADLLSFPG